MQEAVAVPLAAGVACKAVQLTRPGHYMRMTPCRPRIPARPTACPKLQLTEATMLLELADYFDCTVYMRVPLVPAVCSGAGGHA